MSLETIPNNFRSRGFPARLCRHLFGEFIFPLLCALLAFSVLFLLNDVFDDLPDFSGNQVPFHLIVWYFLCKLPLNLLNVVPMSTLLATSFMTVLLGKNNELCAMRSAGLSLAVCTAYVWLTALVLCLAVWFLGEKIVPRCQQELQAVQNQWLEDKPANKQRQLLFHNYTGRRSWFFQDFQPQGRSAAVVLRQYHPDGRTEWVLTAERAEWQPGQDDKDGTWEFQRGQFYNYKYSEHGIPKRELTENFAVRKQTLPETPSDIGEQSKDLEMLTMGEIRRILASGSLNSEKNRNMLSVLFWHRLSFPLASLIGALFGFALTIAEGRAGVMRGFASAVGLLVLFYVVSQFTLVLGKNSYLPPFAAGALPELLFLGAGIFLVYKRQ